ncbi:MAG: hypothetical protein JW763_02205 [candidate division Zixibacteria bacterium]|nr:hypothetical protein [candidate division Zixibacteria bacterium]
MHVCTKIAGVLFVFGLLFVSTQAGDEEAARKFEQPILISSAGQSADMKLIGMLAKKQKLDAKAVNMAQVSDLDGIKTLIIVPGFSSKGLGAAGVSQKEEMERVEKLVAAAQEKKIPIVMIHIGGNARRKGQSDAFNKLTAEVAERMIVVQQGDEDGFFSEIAREKKIPITLVEKIAEVATPLGELF